MDVVLAASVSGILIAAAVNRRHSGLLDLIVACGDDSEFVGKKGQIRKKSTK